MFNLDSPYDEYLWEFPTDAVAVTITYMNSGEYDQEIEAWTAGGGEAIRLSPTLDADEEARLGRKTHCFQTVANALLFPGNTTGNEVFINSVCIVTTASCQ